MIAKFAKKGMTPSQIGVLLRDSHGIAQVKSVTGSKILRILKGQGERHTDVGRPCGRAGASSRVPAVATVWLAACMHLLHAAGKAWAWLCACLVCLSAARDGA